MYKEKVCKVCGQTFIPNSARQVSCNRVIKKVCPVCGEEFESKCTVQNTMNTCGKKECHTKYARQQIDKSYQQSTKICQWCGQEFHPKTNTQLYCGNVHYAECKVCGKRFKVNLKVAKSNIRKTCSAECAKQLQGADYSDPEVVAQIQAKMQATCMERYGVAHPAQNAEVRAKMRATTKERYGVEYFIHSPEYRDKTIATNLAKYGVEWQMQALEVRAKVTATNIKHYGVPNHMQNPEFLKKYQDNLEAKTGYRSSLANPEVREKGKQTTQEKYGTDFYSQTAEFKERFKQTSLERFGTENPNQNDDIKAKTRETSLMKYGATNYLSSEEGKKHVREAMKEKYGVEHALLIPELRKQLMTDPSKYDEWVAFESDPIAYLSQFAEKQSYAQLSARFGVSSSVVNDFVLKHHLEESVNYTLSNMEDEVVDVIRRIDPNVKIKRHVRQTIKPNELDIMLPELGVAIECNPTSTHNSSRYFIDPSTKPMPVAYHRIKTDKCEQAGIFLFHIFGYEWIHKRAIIESMLRNLLKHPEGVVYARKCQVKEVSNAVAREFLSQNHRQGSASSSVRLGLYYQDRLVSLMTFGKMRSTIGTGHEDLANCWELVRFCSLINMSVIGGASKLFSHFVELYAPQQIRSFSDRSHTRGLLYSTLGFNELRRSDPNYVWVDYKTDKAYHRVNAQKKNLKKFLKDENIDLSKSEKQVMEEHGFVQVYDSGTITWEWRA